MKSESLIGHLFLMLAKFTFDFLGSSLDDNRSGTTHTLSSAKTISAGIKWFLVICAIISFVGVEAVKIIFRKNFGSRGINFFGLAICIICFLATGIVSLVFFSEGDVLPSYMGICSFVFYISLSVYLTIKGIKYWKDKNLKTEINPYYEGDSYLLKGLTDNGWSVKKVQSLAEPLLTIAAAIGIIVFLGPMVLPIIFCGLSVWIYQLTTKIFGYGAEKGVPEVRTPSNNSGFSYVHYD